MATALTGSPTRQDAVHGCQRGRYFEPLTVAFTRWFKYFIPETSSATHPNRSIDGNARIRSYPRHWTSFFTSRVSLFTRRYGMNKKAQPAGRAASLISKYAYFLTEYHFPIFDSLAVSTYNKIAKRMPELRLEPIPIHDPLRFFRNIAALNRYFGDFNLLDNLLWLMGKVHNGNLSLVMRRDQFVRASKVIDLPMTYSGIISGVSESKTLSAIFGPALCDFIMFSAQFK